MADDQESTRHVVVTDIRMPFWSMVVLMVKWAIAAIPALLLLAVLAAAAAALFGSVQTFFSSSDGRSQGARYSSTPPAVEPPPPKPVPKPVPYPANTPDRCKGSYDLEKCIAREQALAQETPEERAQRQRALDADRSANMQRVK